MATDPIKLVKNILEPKATTTAAKTETKATTTAAEAKPKAGADYKLSSSLNAMLSGTSGGGSRTQELANYTAKGLKDAFQQAHEARAAEAKSSTKSNPMDDVLAASKKAGTNAPQLSAQAQAIIDQTKPKTTADQKSGVSKIIGTA